MCEFWYAIYRSAWGVDVEEDGVGILAFERFLDRIDEPEKNWKFSLADIEERGFWAQYMHAYEACMGATSTKTAPWYVVPADDKENARLIISGIVVDTFKSLQMGYPETDKSRRLELEAIRKRLVSEDPS